MLSLLFAFSAFQIVIAQSNLSLTNVTQAFSQAQIVPDVLPSFNPVMLVNATFTGLALRQDVNVTPGILLPMNGK